MVPAIQYDIFFVSLPTHESLATARDVDPTANRDLVFVRATDGDGVVGWGECSALNARGYNNEWARGAFGLLTSGFPVDRSGQPMAFAGLEMAELDLALKRNGLSLADHLGVARSQVTAGAVVGLGAPAETNNRVGSLVAAGYQRVKLKITSGGVVGPVEHIRQEFPGLELQVDANGSLGEPDIADLVRLAEFGVTMIEQPFAVDDHVATSQLRDSSSTPVFADESVRTVDDAESRPWFDGLVIKPGPSGGITTTLALLAHARERGLALSAGGMLESGLGRHYLAAIAALDAFSITGDVSPASRWLAADPWRDLEMRKGQILVPNGPGVAPAPDENVLERFTVAQGRLLLQ
jgi:O-succinylbenzoate synthase